MKWRYAVGSVIAILLVALFGMSAWATDIGPMNIEARAAPVFMENTRLLSLVTDGDSRLLMQPTTLDVLLGVGFVNALSRFENSERLVYADKVFAEAIHQFDDMTNLLGLNEQRSVDANVSYDNLVVASLLGLPAGVVGEYNFENNPFVSAQAVIQKQMMNVAPIEHCLAITSADYFDLMELMTGRDHAQINAVSELSTSYWVLGYEVYRPIY